MGAGLGKQQPEEMINLSHSGNGRFPSAAGDPLFNGDGRRKTIDQIDVRLFQLLHELPGVGRHAIEKPALAFREKDVERQSGFARAAETSDYYHLIARNAHVDVLEVVLACAMDFDGTVRQPPG